MLIFVFNMVETSKIDFCAFHYTNEKDGSCAQCGLPICKLDQHFNVNTDRICQLCNNITRAKKQVRYIQISIWVVIIAAVIVLWQLLPQEQFLFAFTPVILMLVTPYILRPLIMRFYFRDLLPIESILPIIRYFEASGNLDHYKLFMKFLDKLTEAELEEIRTPLFDYLVPALAFNYSKLPEGWEEDLVKGLKITEEKFIEILTTNYSKQLIRTAVHSAQANISLFIFYLGEKAENDLVKDYIKAITSPEIVDSSDEELNTIYNKLLEDVFLYEEKFNKYCDELNLEKEKAILSQLLTRYEPPPVPKNQLEAVLTPVQLKEKRIKEGLEATSEPKELQGEIVEVKEEEVKFVEPKEEEIEFVDDE